MNTQVTTFENAKLPSFLRAPADSITNALAALAGSTFPFMSIKGKRFAVVRNKEETIIMRPDDDDTPANAIEVVIVNSATTYAKVFYATGYTDGSKEKPTCFSNDGVAPDAQATDKQAKKCAACAHNVWGSGTNGKGKACSDSLRIAVAKPDELNDPMLLRVPPASLKAVTEYAAMLSRKGAPLEGVVTKIKFDPSEATPKLLFTAVNYLSQTGYDEAKEIAQSHIVQQIIGKTAMAAQATASDDEDDTPPPKKIAAPKQDMGKLMDEEEDKMKKAAEDKPKKTPTATKAAELAAKLKAMQDDEDDDE